MRIDKRELENQAMLAFISLIDRDKDVVREQTLQPTLILRESA